MTHLKPMSIGYVKQVRSQVMEAISEANKGGAKYTPVFWTGSHLRPVLIKLYLNSNKVR
jgi:hypothetical protein